ncbi:hypothetical protein PHPALM_31042 [Phytophthora palmivora]|uniref:Reverse transcriptase RNase H-like domain-containing protein n=1 Tax=Phytophthora palmivora TaxID=4796 RepID=A0A2P4X3M0_9STRA|nr:hypothetical protein PHPALM_31042 [Phytophthora palmivora]
MKGKKVYHHQLLVCKGGSFKGSQLQCSVAEKEAFPLDFRIYTDHANVIHIFCPDRELKNHADIVPRWPVREDTVVVTKVKAVQTHNQPPASLLRLLQDDSFERPSNLSIQEVQSRFRNDKLWIRRQAKDLLTRMLLVAPCDIHSHRGQQVIITQLEQHFAINRLTEMVTKFLSKCLLYKHIKGEKLIQSAWSDTDKWMERNEYPKMSSRIIASSSHAIFTNHIRSLDRYKPVGLPPKLVFDQGAISRAIFWLILQSGYKGSKMLRQFTRRV